ncbi:hypothetical protein DFH09DRAFT_1371179 [Mycena vulgaris]|nr:hypothetical protein DFH09DRAFT_1371179 [Mycena vulgaris]
MGLLLLGLLVSSSSSSFFPSQLSLRFTAGVVEQAAQIYILFTGMRRRVPFSGSVFWLALPFLSTALQCPPVDKDGTALTRTEASAEGPPVQCIYPGAGVCSYFAAGPVFVASSSATCPDTLVDPSSTSTSTISTTSTSTSVQPTSASTTTSTEESAPPSRPTTTTTPVAPSPPTSSHTDEPTPTFSTTATSTSQSGTTTPRSTHISTTTSSGISSSGTSSTANTIGASISVLSPTASTTVNQNTLTTPRKRVSPAAIAGGAVGFGVVVAVLFLLLWLRRRRQRNDPRMVPRPYTVDETALAIRVDGTDTKTTSQSEKEPRPVTLTGDSEQESSGNALPMEDAGDSTQPGAMAHRGAEGMVRSETPLEDGGSPNETVTQRLRRVEAQLATLLRTGVPDSAPPSYYSTG